MVSTGEGTTELRGDLRHGSSGPHLDNRPLGRSRGEQAAFDCDPVIGEHPGICRTPDVHTSHPVLLPPELHRHAVDGELDVVDDRTILHLGSFSARLTDDTPDHLLDYQFDLRAASFVVEHPDVFKTHEGLEDLVKAGEDEGVCVFWVTPKA